MAMVEPDPTAKPESSATSSPGWWLLAALALAVGLGLRMALAVSLGDDVAEWEADLWIPVLDGWIWGPVHRVRAPGAGWVFAEVAAFVGRDSLLLLRAACVALATGAFVVALGSALVIARHTRAGLRQPGLAAAWACGVWAASPNLVLASVHPAPETVVGAAGCLALGALAARTGRWRAPAWLALVVGLSALAVAGGVVAASAIALGVLVYLLPVPRASAALPLLLAALLAAGAWWWAARGPDASRRWQIESAPVHSLADLLDAPLGAARHDALDADERTARLLDLVGSSFREASTLELLRALSRRVVVDLLGPDRFRDAPLPGLPLALLDDFLRGGMLLFAAATLALLARGAPSSWPRGGLVAALLALGLLSAATATGPGALAGFDLIVLCAASAGVAGSGRDGGRARRLGFAVGGLMLASLGASAWWSGQTSSDFLRHRDQESGQGRQLVQALLQDSPAAHLRAASLMLDAETRLLRQPDGALRHAELGSRALPDDEAAIGTMIQALVERQDFEAAEGLAETLLDDRGRPSPRGGLLRTWVAEQRRIHREQGGR